MSLAAPSVVIDARMATDGGIGTYLQQVVPRIAACRPAWRITALGALPTLRALGWNDLPNIQIRQASPRIFSVREQLEMPMHAYGADLFWSPNYNIPLATRRRIAVTVHDVNHLALPELLGGAGRRWYARRLLSSALARANRVLYDSEFTRAEATRLVGDGAHGRVVHLGVDGSWHRSKAEFPERPIREPYFLYVGNIKRHKNVPFLIRAFASVSGQLPQRLVLIGRTEGLRADPEVQRAIDGLGGRALLLGERSAPEVRQYVAHADALVTASLYEGFGLPALEAMAAGTPCVLSHAGSLPEIAGDAALYADPRDEASFAQRMIEVVSQPALRDALIARGRARAGQFSWERCAERTAGVLDEALAS